MARSTPTLLAILTVIVVAMTTAKVGNGEFSYLAACNITCVYTFWALDADCRQCGLTSVPVQCRDAETFDLRNNQITSLPAGTFEEFGELRYLDIEMNSMEWIEPGAFTGTDNLLHIYAQSNKLQRIRRDTFIGASTLLQLYLNDNQILVLESRAFHGIPLLETLFLSNNNITDVPYDLFHKLTMLRYLFIENNLISVIQKDTFKGLVHLKHLSLAGNRITHVPAGAFDDLKNLKALKLSFNYIVSFELGALPPLIRLNHLDLFKNMLTGVQNFTEVFQPLKIAKRRKRGASRYGVRSGMNDYREVFLAQNPLHCDCSIEPLRVWMQENMDSIHGRHRANVTCKSPQELAQSHLCNQERSLCPPSTTIMTPTPMKQTNASSPIPGRPSKHYLLPLVISVCAATAVVLLFSAVVLVYIYLKRNDGKPKYTRQVSNSSKGDSTMSKTNPQI